MNAQRVFFLGLTACASLGLTLGSARAADFRESVAGRAKQRFVGQAGGRMQSPAAGGSIRFQNGMGPGVGTGINPGVNPGFNPGFNPAMNGSMRFQPQVNPTQGIQPANLRVPFTYTQGGPFYANRMPWGNFNYSWGGVPYFWYNNFWFRSMWYRGMPYYFAVPNETIPPEVVQQWTMWNQLKQQENQRNAGQLTAPRPPGQ